MRSENISQDFLSLSLIQNYQFIGYPEIFRMSKWFIDEVGRLLAGEELDNQNFWNMFDHTGHRESDNTYKTELSETRNASSSLKGNSYYYSLKLFKTIAKQYSDSKLESLIPRMVNTLLSIECFFNPTQKSPTLVEECNKIVEQLETKLNSYTLWVLKIFISSCNQSVLLRGFIKRMALCPDGYNPHIDPVPIFQAQRLANVARPFDYSKIAYYECLRGNRDLQINIEIAYGYLSFVNHISKKQVANPAGVYQEIINCLNYLMNVGLKKSEAVEHLLLVLTILSGLLKYYLIPPRAIIKQLIVLAKTLQSFPEPIGIVAQVCFEMLYKQLRSPGSNYRNSLRALVPALDTSQNPHKTFITAYVVRQEVPLYAREQSLDLDTLRKSMILSIINSHSDDINKNMEVVHGLSSDGIFDAYCRLNKMEQVVQQLQNYEEMEKVQQKCVDRFLNIVDEIDEKVGSTEYATGKLDQHSAMKPKLTSRLEIPIFELVPIYLKSISDPKNKHRYFRNMLTTLKAPHQKLRYIIQLSDKDQRRFIQTICEAYLDVKKSGGDADEFSKKFEIYVLPRKKQLNNFAKFLASKDPWYSRFIYNIFRHHSSYPRIDHLLLKSSGTLPYTMKDETLQMFLREAQHDYNVKIYKCRIKRLDKEPQIFYFCQYMYIGLSAEVEFHRHSKQKYEHLDAVDLYLNKMKESERLAINRNINLEILVCGPSGKPYRQQMVKNLSIHNIKLCHLPVDFYVCKRVEPHYNNLELSVLPAANYRNFVKEISKKNIFHRISPETAKTEFTALFSNHSVSGIRVEAVVNQKLTEDQLLKVVIDGEYLYQVESLQVVPAFQPNKEFRIPFKTFVPIS